MGGRGVIHFCTHGDALTGMGHVVRCQALEQVMPATEADVLVCDHPPGYACHQMASLKVQLVDLLTEAQQGYDLTFSAFDSPQYAILRPQFLGRRTTPAQGTLRVLLSFGGSDPADLLSAATHALAGEDVHLTAVLGPSYANTPRYRAQWGGRVVMHNGPVTLDNDMASHMADADVLVCSGGMTVLEAACVGLPCIVMAQNDREHERRLVWQHWYTGLYLGRWHEVHYKDITRAVQLLRSSPDVRQQMTSAGRARVDGHGAQRVAWAIHQALRNRGHLSAQPRRAQIGAA